MNQITMMMWSLTQSQSFWSVKSSGPQEALLLIKLMDVMEFQQNYSKPQKMMLSKCCTQYFRKCGRPCSGHRTGKGQSLSQFPGRVVLKNVPTIGRLHLSPMLVRSCLKSCMLGFSIRQTQNFQMSKLGLEKDEEPEIKLTTFAGLQRKVVNSRKTSTSVSSAMLKPLMVCLIVNCGKLLKRWEYQTILLGC